MTAPGGIDPMGFGGRLELGGDTKWLHEVGNGSAPEMAEVKQVVTRLADSFTLGLDAVLSQIADLRSTFQPDTPPILSDIVCRIAQEVGCMKHLAVVARDAMDVDAAPASPEGQGNR